MIDAATAEHEAAHVVVGLALGLKLKKATIEPTKLNGEDVAGYAWFTLGRKRLAFGIMCCAGIAWESRPGGRLWVAAGDTDLAHEYLGKTGTETGVRLARELLDARRRVHAKIASELCDRDLSAADVEALVID